MEDQMRTQWQQFTMLMIGLIMTLVASGCSHPRIFVATGTLVGLEATPGDLGEGQVPQVTFGYRRSEVAIVPVKGDQAATSSPSKQDAASTLTTFNLALNWFGPARIEQYIATGHASRDIIKGGQFALSLVGYEKGVDVLADQFAGGYKNSVKKNATDQDKACWKAVTNWMNDKFPGLAPLDIVTTGFSKQRPTIAADTAVKAACNIS